MCVIFNLPPAFCKILFQSSILIANDSVIDIYSNSLKALALNWLKSVKSYTQFIKVDQ
jgi:hypothetical protein